MSLLGDVFGCKVYQVSVDEMRVLLKVAGRAELDPSTAVLYVQDRPGYLAGPVAWENLRKIGEGVTP